jgi:hypothetical protein
MFHASRIRREFGLENTKQNKKIHVISSRQQNSKQCMVVQKEFVGHKIEKKRKTSKVSSKRQQDSKQCIVQKELRENLC